MKKKFFLAIHLLVLAGLVGACGSGGSGSSSQDATLEAISAAVRGTATVAAAAQENPNAPIETAQAEATANALEVEATQAAQNALSDQARAATATAFAPFVADLPKYGVDPAQGRPGWIHPPVTLAIDGFLQYDFLNQYVATVAQDFVISSDISWDTQYGSSGCGFVMRSNGNRLALDQYMAIITRGASGHLVFSTMSDGDIVSGRDIYAYGKDPNFNWGNKVTNRLTVVGRGLNFSVYSNDTLIGEVDPTAPVVLPGIPSAPNAGGAAEQDAVATQITSNYQARQREAANAEKAFDRGLVALVVLSESGRSVCTFENTWLWLIE
jgi:hypothetical protein